MAIEGLHHVTAITGDAPGNVEFYARALGLRMVKKTVNFDSPDVYHLYYGDDVGTPGSILTFFEFPHAAPGVRGAGEVHEIAWRVGDPDALAFWEDRLAGLGVVSQRGADGALRFADPEGLAHALVTEATDDAPLVAHTADVPATHALRGFAGVRAYAGAPDASAPLLEHLGFTANEDAGWRAAGSERGGTLTYDPPPTSAPARQGAGSVHHVAWSLADDGELALVREAAASAGAHATGIIDRQYFHSVYFREPSGVLFELATRDVGFDVDEPRESLGEALMLPPQHESRRAQLEAALTPLVNPARAPRP